MARNWTTPESWTDNKAISTARLNEISTQLTWLYEMLFAKEGSALTIASGVIAVTGNESFYKVSGEGASADDLVTINGGTDGDIIILAYDGEAITLKDGTGNIDCGNYGDLVLGAAGTMVMLRHDGSNWGLLNTNVTKFEADTAPKAGGDADWNNKDLANLKQVDFYAYYDNGDSGTAKTINWNNGNKQKLRITGNACDLSLTDPAGPCSLTLRLIGNGTLYTNVDADHDADCEYVDDGDPAAYGSGNNVVIGTLYFDFDPSSTPKYTVAGVPKGAA